MNLSIEEKSIAKMRLLQANKVSLFLSTIKKYKLKKTSYLCKVAGVSFWVL